MRDEAFEKQANEKRWRIKKYNFSLAPFSILWYIKTMKTKTKTKTPSVFPIVFEDNGILGRGNPIMDLQLTQEQANALFTEEEIKNKEKRFGSAGFFKPNVRGIVVRGQFKNNFLKKLEIVKADGTLSNLKPLGYEVEGRISISGKKIRGFTSSKIFRLPDGELISVSVIHLGS